MLTGAAAPSSRAAPVRLQRLRKHYGRVVAVDGIDLEIAAGEFVTLLGPSGSGKTTTLMMIAGFQEATEGSIYVGDRDITNVPPNRRNIGVVFQHYALFPHMRVADNVAFPLRMRGMSKPDIQSGVSQALELVKLAGYDSRFPRQLSGGQQQRVALARALVFEPNLALMDEPLGALDRQLREQMQYEIKRVQKSLGVTVIYVTHDQGEALVMSDRIAVMNHGLIEQYAAPEELYNKPATTFVATFVGESNLLNGYSRASRGTELELETESGHRFVGRASQPISPGAGVVAAIRPEKLELTDDDADNATSSPNSLDVRCEEATYAGEESRYVVRSATGERLILRVQNRSGARRYSSDDSIRITWSLDDLRVFPVTEAEMWTEEGIRRLGAAPDGAAPSS